MSWQLFLVPMFLGAVGYCLYVIKDFLRCLLFASMNVEELGSFMEVCMNKLKKIVWNKNWTIGRYSMVKTSADNIKKSQEIKTFALDSGFYIGFYKKKFLVALVNDVHYQGFGDWQPRHPGIKLVTFRWNQHILLDFIKECKREEKPIDNYATGWHYESIQGRKRSGFQGIFLPEGMAEKIRKHVEWFCSEEGERWYRDMHQPYKLVYLFHGSNGSGKTALARAIADVTQRSLTHIRLVTHTDQRDISHETVCFVAGCKNDVILIDEIDKLFIDDTEGKRIDSGTLLALLNGDLLDGQIIILTANDLDFIPQEFRAALLRARRIDHIYEFGNPTDYQKQEACKFYGVEYTPDIQQKNSMADLMATIMQESFDRSIAA